jgi:hypothetical protein
MGSFSKLKHRYSHLYVGTSLIVDKRDKEYSRHDLLPDQQELCSILLLFEKVAEYWLPRLGAVLPKRSSRKYIKLSKG